MYKLLTLKEIKKLKSIKNTLNDNQLWQYIYSKGYHDVDFFIDFFLWQYKTDKKTGDSIKSSSFHKELIDAIKSEDDTLVIVPRDHAKSTTSFFVMMHDICYSVEPSILLVMAKWLWLETIWKIRDEFETNHTITKVFWRLVPQRTREEANKKWTQSQLQFMNWVTIESVTMWWSIRGKRPTKIVVDDPQENSDVINPQITDRFNNRFFSSVYNTLDPSWKCVVIWTMVWSLCLVNFILQEWRWFKCIKYESVIDPVFDNVDWKVSIIWWTPLRWEKRSIESLNDRLQKIWDKIFMQEYMNVPYIQNGSPVYDTKLVSAIIPLEWQRDQLVPWLKIFWQPQQCYYWVDTATWIEWWDFSTIIVRNSKMDLIAQYRQRIPPHKLCEIIDYLWKKWYQWVIWIERNNSWISTLNKAEEYSRYSLLYSEKTVDKITNKKTKKVWWSTNTKTKPLMINHHVECFVKSHNTQYSEEQKKEMMFYYHDEKWSTNAIAPHHDDLIIADALCLQMLKWSQFIKIMW
jgi:hypothetical protein